jgi:hypothetical protein
VPDEEGLNKLFKFPYRHKLLKNMCKRNSSLCSVNWREQKYNFLIHKDTENVEILKLDRAFLKNAFTRNSTECGI